MSYSAIVCRITTRPHPAADRLQLGNVFGFQVVLDLQPKSGDIGVFFPTDGKLSHQMLLSNNLYNNSALEKLGLPAVEKPGFFGHNGRVRSQRFRGERSDGLWLPIDSLAWTDYDIAKLKEGDQFTELDGDLICEKYYTPATRRLMAQGKTAKTSRRETMHFRLHPDTPQFRFVADGIKAGSVCYITEKIHGTSARVGRVLDELPFGIWARVVNKVWPGLVKPTRGYRTLNGSRNVILEHSAAKDDGGYYGTHAFRYEAVDGLSLHKGECLYLEIAGYVDERPIMSPQAFPTTDIGKLLTNAGFINPMNYAYGCPVGTRRIFVYKITQTNEDGVMRELPWTQVVARCRELGVTHVPVLYGPFICQDSASLRLLVEMHTGSDSHPLPSSIDPSHIREGVVLRAENEDGIHLAKSKQFAFGVLEGYLKERDDVADLEEAA